MSNLYLVLDSIVSAKSFGHPDTIDALRDTHEVLARAQMLGMVLSYQDAERIQEVGLRWFDNVKVKKGEWRRFRESTKAELLA